MELPMAVKQKRWTVERLKAFTQRVVDAWERGEIRAPVHLDDGNEEQLLDVFRAHHRQGDWVLGSWRMQLKCLLAGVPEGELFDAVLGGRAISLCFPDHRVISSAIVGGTLPIALGVALGIKRRQETNKVICFLGDMTAETGIFHECLKYSRNFDLPVLWVVEDNGKSVCTDTRAAWNSKEVEATGTKPPVDLLRRSKLIRYKYESRYPHAGTGRRIEF